MSIDGILEVVLVAPGPGESAVVGTTQWSALVEAVLFDMPPVPLIAGDGEYDRPLPNRLSTIDIAIPTAVDVSAGRSYNVAVTKIIASGPEDEWPWIARIVLDAKGSVSPGTPVSLANEVATITFAGETQVEGLAAYFATRAPFLTPEGDRIPEGERELSPRDLALVAASGIGPSLNALAGDAESRQLPDGLDAIDQESWSALGVGDLVDWQIAVVYDPAGLGTTKAVGFYFPGVGYLGPEILSTSESLTTVRGLAPASPVGVEVVRWATDQGDEIAERGVADAHLEPLDLDVSTIANALAAGGGLWVDLVSGEARLLNREAFAVELQKYAEASGDG